VKCKGWIVLFVLGIFLVFSNLVLADTKTQVTEADVDAVIEQAQTAMSELQNQVQPQDSSSVLSERLQRRINRAIIKAQRRIDSALVCENNGNLPKAMSEAKHALKEIERIQKKITRETQKQGGEG